VRAQRCALTVRLATRLLRDVRRLVRGLRLYGDDVAVLDLAEREVVARIPVGRWPNGISYSPFAPATGTSHVPLEMPEMGGMEH